MWIFLSWKTRMPSPSPSASPSSFRHRPPFFSGGRTASSAGATSWNWWCWARADGFPGAPGKPSARAQHHQFHDVASALEEVLPPEKNGGRCRKEEGDADGDGEGIRVFHERKIHIHAVEAGHHSWNREDDGDRGQQLHHLSLIHI